MRRTLTVLLAAIALQLVGCTVNPATGKRQFNMVSPEQEVALGAESAPQVAQQYGGKLDNAAVQQYVTEIGMKLTKFTEGENPKLPWEFTVLNSDVVNAFSLPGGKVFLSRGLAQMLQNEAQLAGVLGHEIGHVTARHINDQMLTQSVAQAAGELASTLLEGRGGAVGELTPQVIQLGQQSFVLRFGRKDELQADDLGLRYMSRGGYDPSAMRGVMEILDKAMGTNRGMEFFSTHPYPETRIKAINATLAKDYSKPGTGTALNAAQYQQRMLKPLGGKK